MPSAAAELAAPLRALASLLPETAGVSCHQAELVYNQLSPKEVEAVKAFVEAGQKCLAKLTQASLDNLKRLLAGVLPAVGEKKAVGGAEAATVYELFDKFDRDGNGLLTKPEFTEACRSVLGSSMTEDEINALLKNCDVNNSGDVDIHEFVVWLYAESNSRGGSKKPSASDMESSLPIGTRVRVEGLTGAAHLNGQFGVVCGTNPDSGRYIVNLEGTDEKKSLKLQNLIAVGGAPKAKKKSVELPKINESKSSSTAPQRKAEGAGRSSSSSAPPPEPDLKAGAFTVGDRVRAGGLNGAKELNGQLGVVFGLDKASGRYLVEFENGAGQKHLRLENLTAMGVATGHLAAKARMFAACNQQS